MSADLAEHMPYRPMLRQCGPGSLHGSCPGALACRTGAQHREALQEAPRLHCPSSSPDMDSAAMCVSCLLRTLHADEITLLRNAWQPRRRYVGAMNACAECGDVPVCVCVQGTVPIVAGQASMRRASSLCCVGALLQVPLLLALMPSRQSTGSIDHVPRDDKSRGSRAAVHPELLPIYEDPQPCAKAPAQLYSPRDRQQ